MLRGGIIHNELTYALASMGHGDLLIVSDAGFPIPSDAWRIELAITRDFPGLVPVLEIIASEFIAEKVMYAQQVVTNNAPFHRELQRIFNDCDHEPVEHERILGEFARQAKAIVRTGGYVPWGNTVLVAGTDPFAFFNNPEVVIPPFYEKRIAQVRKARESR
jgi:D-ribose pyranose/furanose isomerase RbsD